MDRLNFDRGCAFLVGMMTLFIALVCLVDGAVVYQWTDAEGVTHYTNNPATIPSGATVTTTTGQDVNVVTVDEQTAPPADSSAIAADPVDSVEEPTEPDQLPPDAQLTPEEQAAQQQAIAEQQGQVNSVNDFETPLAASGQWIDVEGDRVWQPSPAVVGPNFVPYQTHGHWEWTAAGWVFVSDFDWGWAAFHYGRWWQSPSYGWLWYPDLNWGPAWVSWRLGGGYAGWAPLWPRHIRWHPRWCFVPTHRFGDRAFGSYALRGTGYATAYRATARLPFHAHGPSMAGVQRWGGHVPMGSLDRPGSAHGRMQPGWSGGSHAPGSGGFRAPAPSSGGFRAPPSSGGYAPPSGGFRAPPPSSGGVYVPPSGGFRAPAPSSGGFRAPPSSGGYAPPSGGFRAPPPSSGGFGGSSHSPPPSFGGAHAPAPSSGFGGANHGGGGAHVGGGGHGHR